MRDTERAAALNAQPSERLKALIFDGNSATPELRSAIAEADAALVSVPPDDNGDPVLRACGDVLAHAQRLRAIVYLSTIGVYGDRGGAWVDEATPPQPGAARSRERLAAEQAWMDFGARHDIAVAILRLAGIYGPGQNALVQIASGKARRIVKPGQVFNRIHVGDIAQAIDAAFTRRVSGVFNVADDAPTPPADPIVFAAQLMGVEPPPEIPFEASRAVDVADGAEFLAGMPPREERQAQTPTRRQLALSDLSRGVTGVIRREVIAVYVSRMRCSTKWCTADPGSSRAPSSLRSRVCTAPLRFATCCGAPGKQARSSASSAP